MRALGPTPVSSATPTHSGFSIWVSPVAMRRAFVTVALSFGLACGSKPSSSTGSASAQAGDSAPTTSASAVAPAPVAPDSTPKGAGFSKTIAASAKDSGCNKSEFELATYLLRGELTLGARKGANQKAEFAASWLVQLQGKAQIGFAGYDHEARRIARDRGIGNAREHAPRLFGNESEWTVVWFDDQGLAYAHPQMETNPTPDVLHLSSIKTVDWGQVALAQDPKGLIVASPFGAEVGQLSIFLFAPAEGRKAEAIGVTKDAKQPTHPAVTSVPGGYLLSWLSEGGVIFATRFDEAGKQLASSLPVVAGGESRDRLSLTPLSTGGALLSWADGDRVLARMLDKDGAAKGDVMVVGKGKLPVALAQGDSAVIAMVAEADGAPDQLVAVRVGEKGVSESAVRVSEGKTAVLDPPAVASAEGRMGFAWTEVMGVAIASKRAWLRTLDPACIK